MTTNSPLPSQKEGLIKLISGKGFMNMNKFLASKPYIQENNIVFRKWVTVGAAGAGVMFHSNQIGQSLIKYWIKIHSFCISEHLTITSIERLLCKLKINRKEVWLKPALQYMFMYVIDLIASDFYLRETRGNTLKN